MEDKNLEFALSFLFFAFYSDAAVLQKTFTVSSEARTWADARMYCQNHHIDLVTWNTVDKLLLANHLNGVSPVWIGLRRDPTNDTVWKWINVASGAGITGDDLSTSSYWASGEQSSLCAYTKNDNLWYSDPCSALHNVCCSRGRYGFSFKLSYTWEQGSQYCKGHNATLATFTYTSSYSFAYDGWIGLYRVANKTWGWVANYTSPYTNWAPGEPSNQDCGSFKANTMMWYSNVCSKNLFFVCYDDNLVVVKESKMWEEALSYCKSMISSCNDPIQPCVYRYTLLSLQDSKDFNYIRDRIYGATTDEVWIGLRYLEETWWWINGQTLDDQECPALQNHCGSLSKNDKDKWIPRDCSERKNFVCAKYKSYI